MDILGGLTEAIKEGFGVEPMPTSYRPPVEERPTAADPEPISQQPLNTQEPKQPAQPAPEMQEPSGAVSYPVDLAPAIQPVEQEQDDEPSFNTPGIDEIEFDVWDDDEFVSLTPSVDELVANREEEVLEEASRKMEEGTFKVTLDEDVVMDSYLRTLAQAENASQKGLTNQGGAEVFMPIKSLEGKGPDKDIMSDMEIGYGSKVRQSWLSDDKSKWPVIDGVPVDVRKGITDRQAKSLMQSAVESAKSAMSKELPNFDKMTASERMYWTDMAYNAGEAVARRNPKAAKAAEQGFTAESMIRTFDYIGAGGEKTRGLLNRRLNMFNEATAEDNGLPAIEEYSWGPEGIKVKFSSPIQSEKVSLRLRNKINKDGGWYTVTSGTGSQQETYSADESLRFN